MQAVWRETRHSLIPACKELHWSLHKEIMTDFVYQLLLAFITFHSLQPENLNGICKVEVELK